jgi:hypothetical protein
MKWYKHDPSAALAGMIGLTIEERGAYYTLIDAFYDRDGHVPDDDWLMARILGCNPRTWRRLKLALFQKQKVTVTDGELIPNRGLSTITEAAMFSERQRNRVRTRWERVKKTNKNNDPPIPYPVIPIQPHPHKKEEDIDADASISADEKSSAPQQKRAQRSKRAKTSQPEDWHPEVAPADQSEFQRFSDYCAANAKVYADWNAAWRNWKTSPYRNAGGQNGTSEFRSSRQPAKYGLAEAFAEIRADLGNRACGPADVVVSPKRLPKPEGLFADDVQHLGGLPTGDRAVCDGPKDGNPASQDMAASTGRVGSGLCGRDRLAEEGRPELKLVASSTTSKTTKR